MFHNNRSSSAIWHYFERKNDIYGIATCNYCQRELSYRTSITNLKTHLKLVHVPEYNNFLNGNGLLASNIESETSTSVPEAVNVAEDNIIVENKYVPPKKKKKAKKPRVLKSFTDSFDTSNTDNEAFGTFIAKKLDKITNSEQRMYAELLITRVVNYANLNKLSENTEICDSYAE